MFQMFILFLSVFQLAFSLQRKENPSPMTIGVIIPCHPNHFDLLEELLACYATPKITPDEIVISLSEYKKIPGEKIERIENRNWPFKVKILKHSQKYPPGRNRNEACQASTSDVIIAQDADDIPHPQKTEIVKYLFENFEIDHLLHQWIGSDEVFYEFDIDGIEDDCVTFRSIESIDIPQIHNGSVVFRRYLFDKVHWKPMNFISEDFIFNRLCYVMCKNKAVLPLPLLKYRGEYSTFDLSNNTVRIRE